MNDILAHCEKYVDVMDRHSLNQARAILDHEATECDNFATMFDPHPELAVDAEDERAKAAARRNMIQRIDARLAQGAAAENSS